VLCFYIGKEYGEVREINNQVPSSSVLHMNDPYENDLSDWKTYRNEEYGFEFKYPKNLEQVSSFGGTKPIINFSDNVEIDPVSIGVYGPYSFPVDSYEGSGDDAPPSIKLNNFDQMVENNKTRGERREIGGFDTLVHLGYSEFNPTLFISMPNNQYIYIDVYYNGSDIHSPIRLYDLIFNSLKRI
jgi:hypothetical protein